MISAQSMAVLKQFISDVGNQRRKASVVLLTYNRWEWTEMALNSVFENTFFPYELIVVDNHSTDETVERLKQLRRQGKINTLILLPRNYGLYVGFNVGLKHGNYNNWLSILPNDFLVCPYWLTALCYVASRLKLGLVSPPCSLTAQTAPMVTIRLFLHKCKVGRIGSLRVVKTTWTTNPSVMTKITLEKIGYFREDVDKEQLSFYAIGDSEYGERARKLGVGTYYVLDLDCKHIPDMLAQQEGKVEVSAIRQRSIEIEKEKYPKYRQWKTDVAMVKRPKWFAGKYARYKRYETRITKEWIEQYLWSG